MPNEMFVEFMCRRMLPKRLTRDMPLGMANEFVESMYIITEGRVAVAAKEMDLLSDDGDIESKRYNEKISGEMYIAAMYWAVQTVTTVGTETWCPRPCPSESSRVSSCYSAGSSSR